VIIIEHPDVSRTLKHVYPKEEVSWGIDYFGDEILHGDELVSDSNTGEVVLKENLNRYLKEVYGLEFKKAE
jgi:hypothetical protein